MIQTSGACDYLQSRNRNTAGSLYRLCSFVVCCCRGCRGCRCCRCRRCRCRCCCCSVPAFDPLPCQVSTTIWSSTVTGMLARTICGPPWEMPLGLTSAALWTPGRARYSDVTLLYMYTSKYAVHLIGCVHLCIQVSVQKYYIPGTLYCYRYYY